MKRFIKLLARAVGGAFFYLGCRLMYAGGEWDEVVAGLARDARDTLPDDTLPDLLVNMKGPRGKSRWN